MALTVKVECLLEGKRGSGEEAERPLGETRVLVKVDLSWLAIGEEAAMMGFPEREREMELPAQGEYETIAELYS